MDKTDDFTKAWKARFSSDVPSDLGVSDFDVSNPNSISQALLVCKTRIDEYQKKLHQQEFIHGYLWDLLHRKKSTPENVNVSDNFNYTIKPAYDADKLKMSNVVGYLPYQSVSSSKPNEERAQSVSSNESTKGNTETTTNEAVGESAFSTNSVKAKKSLWEGREGMSSRSFNDFDKSATMPPSRSTESVNQPNSKDYMNIEDLEIGKKPLERVGSAPGRNKYPKPVPAPRPSVKGPTVKERASALADEIQDRLAEQGIKKSPSLDSGNDVRDFQKPRRRPHQYEYVDVVIGENNGQQTRLAENASDVIHLKSTSRTDSIDSYDNESSPSPGLFSSFKPLPSAKEVDGRSSTPPPVFKRSDSLNGKGSFKSRKSDAVAPPVISKRTESLDSNIDSSESPNMSRKVKMRGSKENIFDAPIPADKTQESADDSSSDEEPVYFNILLLKQKAMQRTNTMYGSVDSHKLNVENQARRLSKKFAQSLDMSRPKTLPTGMHVAPPMLKPLKEKKASNIATIKGVTESESKDTDSIGEARCDSADSLDSTDSLDNVWKKRQSMQMATGDTDSTGTEELDMEVPICQESEKLQMRKWVVNSILESEKAYVNVLDVLQQYMKSFKAVSKSANQVIPDEEIDAIFYKLPELHRIHSEFLKNLEAEIVENWTSESCIAHHFKILAIEELPIASDYLKNYHRAITTIKKLYENEEHSKFMEFTTNMKVVGMPETANLEELLHKPVVRFQRNTLVLHDLIRCTPTSHPDYDMLQKTLKIAQQFLESFQSPQGKDGPENQRYLSRYSPIVEQVGKKRKLRHVFLFNDLIICAKQSISGRKITNEFKWLIPLFDLEMDPRICAQDPSEEKEMAEHRKAEIEALQRKVSELQHELKAEFKKLRQGKDEHRNWSIRSHNKNIEKTRKKLMTEETKLVLASPHLVFKLKHKRQGKTFTFLLSSDYERDSWKETINGLKSKVTTKGDFRGLDFQELINTVKLPKMNTGFLDDEELGMQLEEEHLFGNLHVTIHKLIGLQSPADTFCCVEVDTFGHFFMKAKTNLIKQNREPVWNEEFEVELEGAQTLRILVYKIGTGTDTLIGKCALELSKAWLRGDFQEKSISINEEMSVCASLKYMSRDLTLRRRPSNAKGGVFGVHISTLAKRECVSIPNIIRACVEEIEARGINDVGIYRISGLSSEIQTMKKAFERSSKGAMEHAKTVDVNVLSSLLKLYFRELPEALFTDKLYPKLVEAMALSDPEGKERCLMAIIRELPQPNHSVVAYMLTHLLKVAQNEPVNKMSLNNLATVFGPTLLRPAITDQAPASLDLFSAQARDAMTQTGILLHFLTMRAKGVDFGTRL